MARHKDVYWNLPDGHRNASGGVTHQYEAIHTALLMDIRDELKTLNAVFACPNFVAVPSTLRTISRKLSRPKKTASRRKSR